MSLAYRALYGVGFTPWEQIATLPGVTRQISTLFDREEQRRQPPYGPALDLGCGSGIWAVKLAQRGWQVTGVDFVPKALRRARERADRAGVEVRLVDGDVTRLAETYAQGRPTLLPAASKDPDVTHHVQSARLPNGLKLPYVEQGEQSGVPAAFMDALDAAVLVASSSASFTVQRFAVDHPQRTLGIVLSAAPWSLRDNPAAAAFLDAVSALRDPVDPAFVRESVTITAPTVILWGDRDEIVPRSDQQALTDAIPGSRLVTYTGTGHMVHWEQPQRVAADIVALAHRLRSDRHSHPHGT